MEITMMKKYAQKKSPRMIIVLVTLNEGEVIS